MCQYIYRQVYNIQEIIKQARKRFMKVKNKNKYNRNYNVDFADQEFVIGFCQIALDLFMTSYNTRTI